MQTNSYTYTQYLEHIISQLPGFVAWKTIDSKYAYANTLCAKLAGYKNVDTLIGTTDFDWRCEAVEVADQIVAQDRFILENKIHWCSFNMLRFKWGMTYYMSNKTLLRDPNNNIIGFLFIGTILDNIKVLSFFKEQIAINEKPGLKECSVYPILDEKNNFTELTKRERECLFYYLRGRSSKGTAKLLNISSRTVEAHIANIKYKLNCSSKFNLIEKCTDNGYIFHVPNSIIERNRIIKMQ